MKYSSFEQAIEEKDLLAIQSFPKTDLHSHSILGGNLGYFENKLGITIPRLTKPLNSINEMHKFVEPIFEALPKGIDGYTMQIAAAFSQAASDNVKTLEMGPDVWLITVYEDAKQITDIISSTNLAVAPNVKWNPQIDISRHCEISSILEWMQPFLELGFYKAIDLCCDEFAQPIKAFKPVYRLAKQYGLKLKAHVGEFGPADSVQEAVEELELEIVQHGISAAKSASVMHFLANNKIQLNITPTSNIMLGQASSYLSHPIRKLFDNGIKVTINTDDMLVFNTSLSQEYLNLFSSGAFSAKELNLIRLNGLQN